MQEGGVSHNYLPISPKTVQEGGVSHNYLPVSLKIVQEGCVSHNYLPFRPKTVQNTPFSHTFSSEAQDLLHFGAGDMVFWCRWYGIWVQVVWYLGVGGLMIWCRCQGFLVQVSGHFGAGVTLGGRPAPFHGPQAHFAAQVPYLKTHLRQKVVPPAPKGCTSCAKKQDRPVQGYEAVPFLCERLAPPGHGQGPLDTGRARWIQVPSSGTQETTGGAGVEQSGTESSGRVSPFLLGSARRRDHYPGFLLPATC